MQKNISKWSSNAKLWGSYVFSSMVNMKWSFFASAGIDLLALWALNSAQVLLRCIDYLITNG